MKAKRRKRVHKMNPSLYMLPSRLKALLQTDPEAVQAQLDTLALTDPDSAIAIGESIGLFDRNSELDLLPVYNFF